MGSGIDCSLDLVCTGSGLHGKFYLLKYQQYVKYVLMLGGGGGRGGGRGECNIMYLLSYLYH